MGEKEKWRERERGVSPIRNVFFMLVTLVLDE